MKLNEFIVGNTFYCGTRKWRVTDKGTRTVIAIELDLHKESWYERPPYSVAEEVFDEYDIIGCERKK